MRIKSWWESAVGRLLDWTRNHQLEEAVERSSDRHEDCLEKSCVVALPCPQGLALRTAHNQHTALLRAKRTVIQSRSLQLPADSFFRVR